jgi:hypothetical protein
MLTDHIDTSRLKNDIHILIADCTHLKKLLRTRWTRPMAEEQRRLTTVRRKLTDRFVLLAATRRRLHLLRPPREVRDAGGPTFDASTWDAAAHAVKIASRLLPDYTLAPTMMEAP